MRTKEPVLPVNSDSFKRDVDNLFSLSDDELSKLIESYSGVRKKRASFSIDHVNNIINVEPDKAKSIRSTFIYLVEALNEQSSSNAVIDELVTLGCERKKVETFTKKVQQVK